TGAWTPAVALTAVEQLARYGVASVEQPIPPGAPETLARLRSKSALPLVADESVVTPADADGLIAAGAVDAVNVRVSKCGGVARSGGVAGRAAGGGRAGGAGREAGGRASLTAGGPHPGRGGS